MFNQKKQYKKVKYVITAIETHHISSNTTVCNIPKLRNAEVKPQIEFNMHSP